MKPYQFVTAVLRFTATHGAVLLRAALHPRNVCKPGRRPFSSTFGFHEAVFDSGVLRAGREVVEI
jgi:hypothetical protein